MRLALAACLLAVLTHRAAAQDETQVQLNRFRASETPADAFALSRPLAMGHLTFGAQLHLDYAHDPLVYEAQLGDPETEEASIVAHQLVGTLGFAIGLADRAVLYVGLPVVLAMHGDDGPFGPTPAADGAGLGDAYLGARARILGDEADLWSLAGQLTLTFPTGGGSYRGDDFFSFHPEVLFEVRPEPLWVTANLGARIRDDANFPGGDGVKVGDELTWGVGIGVPIYGVVEPGRSHLDLYGQLWGALAFGDFFGRTGSTGEAIAGVKLYHRTGVTVGAAAGGGFLRGFGNPDARAILQVGWASPPVVAAPEVDEDADTDGDGILDGADACPEQPEDRDGWQDEDGCPDADNDEDHLLDEVDECPDEAEDPDGFDDEDGCPDLDNDGDGVPDRDDRCADQAEDPDGFMDEDGCPDADNDSDGVTDEADRCVDEPGPVANEGCPDTDRDGDGVVDRLDNCPDEAGSEANHGCRQRQRVVIREDRLEILDKVYFATGRARIRGRSFPLLRNVAAVIQAHPELAVIRVEGHTDAEGGDESNLELSQDRANAVAAFLVREGVPRERLRAEGFGETQPLESNDTETGRAANRRVEFEIVADADAAGAAETETESDPDETEED